MRNVKGLVEASGIRARRVAVRRIEASGATHKDNVPEARHWIVNEDSSARHRALCEQQNCSAVALLDVTCPVLCNR
jgi:hypothetical protein